MKYKCLVFDHDDTVVNSTSTIHHPCFNEYLALRYPGQSISLADYFKVNFSPGFLEFCRSYYGMDDAAIEDETVFWRQYVEGRIPDAYEGIAEIMREHKKNGGLICVVSHSFEKNIIRDYAHNQLPLPDAVYGWDRPIDKRKPSAFPLRDIMESFSLKPEDMLVIDDLKPGFDMAKACNVPFAAAGWAADIPEIEEYMRRFSPLYFKSVAELSSYLSADR